MTRVSQRDQQASDPGAWQLVRAQPAPALRPFVREYVGWYEHSVTPIHRRELPTEIVPVIINLAGAIRVFEAGRTDRWTDHDSFSTGAYDTHVIVGSARATGGLQINFTILGARIFFGRPLKELTNLAVPLADLMGPSANTWRDRLRDAPSWDERFAIVDREVARRVTSNQRPAAPVSWAWSQLRRTAGRVAISRLVSEIGWSQRHFISRFRDELGLAPKTLGRVLRFARAVEVLKGDRPTRLADLAIECGYYDQAHFIRDVRQFAGISPGELARSVTPAGGFLVNDLDA